MATRPNIPLDSIRDEIAETIWRNVSASEVPAVCKRLGIQAETSDDDKSEAFSSKRRYVRTRILDRKREELLELAKGVLNEFDSPKLTILISETTLHAEHRVSLVVRKDVLKVFNSLEDVSGEAELMPFLRGVFGSDVLDRSVAQLFTGAKSLEEEISQHYINNPDWTSEELLVKCGALTCSQTQFFELIAKVLHPYSRRGSDQERLAQDLSVALMRDGFEVRQNGFESGYLIYEVVRAVSGVAGAMKNLIFASIGAKPELIFRDALNNDVEIVKNADKVLIYDRPLPPSGSLLWKDLLAWWKELQGEQDEKELKRSLLDRLYGSVVATRSPGELAIFRTYYRVFGPLLREELPMLIPQVYLHYDPYTKRERGDEQFLVRQRMDFLLMLDNGLRVVIEVDGRHHFDDPATYAAMCREDRRLRLRGYVVYRFGAAEFEDTNLTPLRIGPNSQAVIKDFFEHLLRKHGVLSVAVPESGRA